MVLSIRKSPTLRKLAGYGVYLYLRLVRGTCRVTVAPDGRPHDILHLTPAICAMWHGQHFLAPYLRPAGLPTDVMISRSADGEINAVAARAFGLGLIRASGARRPSDIVRKGGTKGFRQALNALANGRSVALTADIPKGPARVAGTGIVLLAQISGRPIVAMAVATSRRKTMNSWDRASLNLPFGRMAMVYGDPIHVPAELDKDGIEDWRQTVQESLNDVTRRAYAIVDGEGRTAGKDRGQAGAAPEPRGKSGTPAA